MIGYTNGIKVNKNFFLMPERICISNSGAVFHTILGSCVSVCLWDKVTRTGGINHFLLPRWDGVGIASSKYGNIAIDQLINKMEAEGCERENIKAKIFGGSFMMSTSNDLFEIGKQNIDMALKMLNEYKIEVIAKHVLGNRGRRIIFDTSNGVVSMKLI